MKHCKKLILMTLYAIQGSLIVYSQDSTTALMNSSDVDTCVNKKSYWNKINTALDCFDMYDGAMQKITELNGEIDTLNMVMDFWMEKSRIFESKFNESQKEIKKHKNQKIWIPIVTGVVLGGVGFGIGKATK